MKIDWTKIKSAEDLIEGGKSDKLSIMDIAEKHDTSSIYIKDQLEKGVEVEKEHTNNKELAEEIAKDHLAESPQYYVELDKMEKKL